MSQTLETPTIHSCEAPPNRKRFTRTECDFMERAGILTDRYELLDGEIIVNVGQNRPHIMVVIRVVAWLIAVFGVERVQTQADVEVASEDQTLNRPQPDAAVLVRPDYEYPDTPSGADLVLAVEVSDSTLRDDFQTKAVLYARAGVPEYWVVDVPGRRLLAHLRPGTEGYAEVVAYADDETVAALAAPDRAVHVSELLPPVRQAPAAGS